MCWATLPFPESTCSAYWLVILHPAPPIAWVSCIQLRPLAECLASTSSFLNSMEDSKETVVGLDNMAPLLFPIFIIRIMRLSHRVSEEIKWVTYICKSLQQCLTYTNHSINDNYYLNNIIIIFSWRISARGNCISTLRDSFFPLFSLIH